MSQEELGAKINYSGSHVSGVELSQRPVTSDFVRLVDEALSTGGLFARMLKELVSRESTPAWFRDWLSAEREAISLRWYEPMVLPGLLQTEDYARAVLACGDLLTPEEIEQHVTSRLERQASVLERDRPPQFVAVIGEAVLHRRIGGDAVMAAQLKHLLSLAERPSIHLHILPNDAHEHAGLSGSFILARLPDGSELGHMDTPLRALVVDKVADIAALHRQWESVRGDCLSRRQSIEFIREAAETWTT